MRNRQRHTLPIKNSNCDDKFRKISVIIPAAGMGNRMKSYGPKSLLTINNSYLISHQLSTIALKLHISYEIILVAGYEADKVFKNVPHDIVKVENENYETTNVVRSIGLGIHACTTQSILLIYGDLVFNSNALDVLFEKSWLSTSDTMSDNEVGCTIDKANIVNLSYDLPTKWAQMGFFTGKEFSLLQNICCKKDNDQLFGFEAINNIIDRGGRFKHMSPALSKVNDIDSSKDLQSAGHILGNIL